MTRKMKKSVILALVLIASLVGVVMLAFFSGLGASDDVDANAAESHTDHADWIDLNSYGSSSLESGRYYLSADYTGNITLQQYANVILCLNGYKLRGTGSGSVITIDSNQRLTLQDCNSTSNTHQYYIDDTGLWKFDDGTDEWDTAYGQATAEKQGTVTGGIITGDNAGDGSVYVGSGGSFTMEGGTISGNTATQNGGGVYVGSGGSFTMEGGAISGNTARYGGGVCIDGGTFTMNGGTISDNMVTGDGGGVYVHGASTTADFTMNDGTISGNTAGRGGGVYASNFSTGGSISITTFIINGGIISDNMVTDSGGGVYVYYGGAGITYFINNGGTISGNTASSGNGGGVYSEARFTMKSGTISSNTASDGGGVYVSNDTFAMEDGTISDNMATQNGGGVYVSSGSINNNGGTISGNTASDGGGVYVSSGTFTMEDGTISSNTANNNGGGVYVNSGSINNNGGTIFGNTATTSGSAIYSQSSDVSPINDGKIAGTIVDTTAKLQIKGGRFELGNTTTDKVGTDTSEGDNGAAVFDNYEVKLDKESDNEYPYLVTRKTPSTGTVEHDGTDGWYRLSEWLEEFGTTLFDGKLFVDQDITLTSTLTIEGQVTLCLNGNKLTGNGSTSVITVGSGYSFTLQDCNSASNTHQYYIDNTGLWKFDDGTDEWDSAYSAAGADKQGTVNGGVITGGKSNNGGGVYISGGSFTISSGTISGNTASSNGGGVCIDGGTFTMSGGTISGNTASSGGGVYVSGGTFTMISGTISDNTASSSNGGGVCVSGGTFTMEDGTISNNRSSRYGGGVSVESNGSYTMEGGTISGNTASSSNGGGVCVSGGTFTMEYGTISNNTASGGGGVYITNGTFTIEGGTISDNTASSGGGVYVYGWSTTADFTMNGGTISGNTSSRYGGGGVYLSSGTFTMNGGTISDNTSSDGGGVYVSSGTFTMEDGTISNNTATTSGSAIYSQSSDVSKINDGKIAGTIVDTTAKLQVKGGRFELANIDTQRIGTDTAEGNNGVALYESYEVVLDSESDNEYPYLVTRKTPSTGTVEHDGTDGWYKLSQWLDDVGMILFDGKYFVDQDITLSSTLKIEGEVTLCLNGNKLTGNGSTSVITVGSGYSFTLQDCNSTSKAHLYYIDDTGLWKFDDGTGEWDSAYSAAGAEKQGTVNGGVITGGKSNNGGGVYISGGSFTISSGTISGNTASSNGGGVYIDGGTFTMSGGTISGNIASSGGGVYVSGGTITMSGGTISSNTASSGGGVYVSGVSITADFTMNGGTISDNTAKYNGGGIYISGGPYDVSTFVIKSGTISDNNAGSGGGVYVGGSSIFTIKSGTLSNNTANGDGGGVCVSYGCSFTMESGTISGNTASRNGGGMFMSGSRYFAGSAYNIKGGTISNNTASSGGGVCFDGDNSSFVMEDGIISENTAENGGGVYVTSGTFTMEGGTISDNTATQNGGGIYVADVTSVINNGTIADNIASVSGNGVYLSISSSSFAIVGGYIKDTIDNIGNGNLAILGGYFVEGSVEDNTIQGFEIEANVVALEEGSDAYQLGYRYTVTGEVTLTFRIDTIGDSQYDGSAITNKYDFTVFVTKDGEESADYDFTFQYTVYGTEDFVDGLPTNAGKYTIKVIFNYYGQVYEKQFDYEITKAKLTVSGFGVVNRPYDGTTDVQLTGTLVGVFDGDDVKMLSTGTIDSADVGNGKRVTYHISLSGADSGNYVLSQSVEDIFVDITQRELEVNWSDTKLTYNGRPQTPTATVITGIVGETLKLTVSGAQTNAGSDYQATASTANGNYILTNVSTTFAIAPKSLTVVWNDTNFAHDGKSHSPVASVDTGIAGETLELVVDGSGTDIGTYTATASMKTPNGNYVLTNTTTQFAINTATLSTADGRVTVYSDAGFGQGWTLVAVEKVDSAGIRLPFRQFLQVAYDITLKNGNETVQPYGKVKVTIKLTEEQQQAGELSVYYIADDGTAQLIESTVSGDTIIFETDHLSVYAISVYVPIDWVFVSVMSSLGVLFVVAIIVAIVLVRKNKKDKYLKR